MKKLTHTDNTGKVVMIDIGNKAIQLRVARASGHITLAEETIRLINDNLMKKGDVLAIAQLAGICAAKKTSDLIPLCHNVALDRIDISIAVDSYGVRIDAEVRCTGKTGAEMEALTAVSVSLLTVYDMCKAVDKNMTIDNIILTEKNKK